jgi:hypothetical protein
MRTKKFVDCATTSLLVGLAVNFVVAAGDQHSVNLENEPPKSKYSPGLAAKIVNLKIESDETESRSMPRELTAMEIRRTPSTTQNSTERITRLPPKWFSINNAQITQRPRLRT